uniref:Filamin A interacting protein 1-like n=1 Tax=Cricetulus griseus TaxID=10029 RepID=A0A8C2LFQ5_CRIGR
MRSRSSNTEGSAPKQFPRHSKFPSLQHMKHRDGEKDPSRETDGVLPHPTSEKSHTGKGHQAEDLSRDDLLFLLSILEGELQARDEVIGILRAEKMDLALLEAQYGFVTPKKVLEALQRDAFQAKSVPWQEDIYEKPMNELDKVIEKHKESHRRILEQLLMVEKSHRQTLMEMEEEKRKHKEYMEKSDEFINLLERECESIP